MKKLSVLLLALALCLSMVGAAYANAADTANVINWEDVEGYLERLEIEGEFYVLSDIGLMFWVPDALEASDAPEDDYTYLGCFLNADGSFGMSISITDPVDGLDFEKYYAVMEKMAETDAGLHGLEVGVINGLAVISFTVADEEGEDEANVMCIVLDDGSVLAFSIAVPQDDEQTMFTALMAASVQPVE